MHRRQIDTLILIGVFGLCFCLGLKASTERDPIYPESAWAMSARWTGDWVQADRWSDWEGVWKQLPLSERIEDRR